MPAQFLERALTQKIGIALARLGTLDDSFGDDSVGEIVCKSEGYASHFERDAQNLLGFRTGIEVAKVRRDGHADLRRGQQISGHKTISVQHHYLDRNDKRHLYHAVSISINSEVVLSGVQAAVLKVRCSHSLALAPR